MRLHEIVADGKRVNHPLIIRTGKSDPRATDQLREDLAVMSRILDKTAEERGESYHAKAAGIEILALSSGGRFARTLYIEDYGVIFTVNVGIPLRGESKADADDEKEAVSTEEWEEARQNIFNRLQRLRENMEREELETGLCRSCGQPLPERLEPAGGEPDQLEGDADTGLMSA